MKFPSFNYYWPNIRPNFVEDYPAYRSGLKNFRWLKHMTDYEAYRSGGTVAGVVEARRKVVDAITSFEPKAINNKKELSPEKVKQNYKMPSCLREIFSMSQL